MNRKVEEEGKGRSRGKERVSKRDPPRIYMWGPIERELKLQRPYAWGLQGMGGSGHQARFSGSKRYGEEMVGSCVKMQRRCER